MITYLFVVIVSISGGYHEYVVDYDLSYDDCIQLMEQTNRQSTCVIEGEY